MEKYSNLSPMLPRGGRLLRGLRGEMRGCRGEMRGFRLEMRGFRGEMRGLREKWGRVLCLAVVPWVTARYSEL